MEVGMSWSHALCCGAGGPELSFQHHTLLSVAVIIVHSLVSLFRYTFVDILRAILLSLETMIEDPELQVNGFILIIDWSNFTFKQASRLTPSMLRLAIEGLQVGSTYTVVY